MQGAPFWASGSWGPPPLPPAWDTACSADSHWRGRRALLRSQCSQREPQTQGFRPRPRRQKALPSPALSPLCDTPKPCTLAHRPRAAAGSGPDLTEGGLCGVGPLPAADGCSDPTEGGLLRWMLPADDCRDPTGVRASQTRVRARLCSSLNLTNPLPPTRVEQPRPRWPRASCVLLP